jgi:hypothetical protein
MLVTMHTYLISMLFSNDMGVMIWGKFENAPLPHAINWKSSLTYLIIIMYYYKEEYCSTQNKHVEDIPPKHGKSMLDLTKRFLHTKNSSLYVFCSKGQT